MRLFRRSKQPRKVTASVGSATIALLADVASLPAHVRSTIGEDELPVCLVKVDSVEGRYTLVLDVEWVALAIEVDRQSDDLLDDLPLPRAAIRAVIHGWATDKPFEQPEPRWSDDGIPHVGFPRAGVSGLSAIE